MKSIILTAVAGVALFGAALAGLWAYRVQSVDGLLKPDDDSIVAQGADIYAAQCAACHGASLQGEPNWRERGDDGRLPAPPHDASGHTWHHDSEALFQLTKYGVAKLIGDPGYASDMPVYDGVLTDNEIVAVLSYIKSTWPQDIRERHDEAENR